MEAVENGAARLRAMIPEGAADLAAAALRVALLQLAALAGQLRAAADLAERTTPGGFARFRRREALRPRRLRLTNDLATLRANLDRSS
ncbi:hypothetical protein, partial [Salmonella sp. M134]|uniref:hypothetical protein n=1 Tax=Salmonella sp. M134 TaxID=3240288 RepID=UPI00352BC799